MWSARPRLGLLGTFTLLALAITGVVAAALVLGVQWRMEAIAMGQAADSAAGQVAGVLDHFLAAEDFAGPLPPPRRQALEALIGREVLRDRVVRVKIWNAAGVVVYSDDPEIVGRAFPIHPYLRAALDGEMAYHVSSLDEEEEARERALYPRLMEIYVPVRLAGRTGAVGAYEVYHDLGALEPQIAGMRQLALVSIAGGFVLLYGVLATLMRGVSRRLAAQARENARLAREAAQVETLRELDRLRSEFLATVGHELRTPLASIKGFASALRQDDVPLEAETQRDFLRTIELDADRLTRLVQDLLDTSRIEAGALRVEPRPASLAEVVERELAMAQQVLGAHEVVVALPPDLPLGCFDGGRVGQVLRNLWENAARHAPPGSRITTEARVVDGWLEVAVLDEGPGVPADHLEEIFARFHRAGGGTEDGARGGMGLGLAICRGIVAAHGGRIWAENRWPAPGAVFRFTLPLAAAPRAGS